MSKKYEIGSVVFRNWVVKRLIGEGSFGKVYEIERENFGTYRAALKVITIPSNSVEVKNAREEGMEEKSIQTYFYSVVEDIVREFALMSRLKGTTNIVSYEDHEVVAHEDGIGWDILIRMELLTPLLTYAYSHPMSRRDIIKIGIDICKALELCQKYNIIHRDIKPENLFVSDNGDYKLGDFGIARTVEKTSSGLSKKGTYSYMAPEVYRGLSYGFSVDIYSLGILLYRLLNANRIPFLPPVPNLITYTAREEALERRMRGDAIELPLFGQGRLGEIVLKACAYEPKERYSSPMEMRQELEAILYEEQDSSIIYPSGDEITLVKNEYVSSSGNGIAPVKNEYVSSYGKRKDGESKDGNDEEDEDRTEFAGAVHISAEITGENHKESLKSKKIVKQKDDKQGKVPAGTGMQNAGKERNTRKTGNDKSGGNARKSGNDEKDLKARKRKWIPVLGGILGFCILLSAGILWMTQKQSGENKEEKTQQAAGNSVNRADSALSSQEADGDYRTYNTRMEIPAENRQAKDSVKVGVLALGGEIQNLKLPEYAGLQQLKMEEVMQQAGLRTWDTMWKELWEEPDRELERYFEITMNALDEMLEENDAVLLTGEGVDSFASFYNATVGRGVYLRRVREILEAHPDKELVADKGKELIWELSLSEDGSPENLTGISGLEDSVSADTEAMYLAGTIAGRSTQSGKVGMLVDQNWMAVYEEYFRAGMKASGKETEMYLYGESFSNTDAGRAVQSFADAGCDIIAGYALSQEVCSLAGKLGIATLSLEDCAKTEHYADINLNGFLKLDGIAEKVAECIRGGFAIDSYVDTLSGLAVSSELPEAISSGFSADISELVLQAQEDYDAFCKAYRTNDLSIPAMTKDVALRTLCMPDLPANAFFLPGQIGENYYVPMEADHGTSLENPGEGLYYNISQEEYQKLVNDIKEATGSKGQREQDSDIVNYQLEFAKDGVVFQADVAYMNFAQVVWVNWSVIGHTD